MLRGAHPISGTKEDTMLKIIGIVSSGLFLFSIILFCAKDHVVADSSLGVVYLKNNIHYQHGPRDSKASYANWTDPGAGHKILPVNTPVTIGKWRRGFLITNTKNNAKICFEFHERNMTMSKEAYLERITSPTKISLNGLSKKDKKGIADGKAYTGMTKNGVRIALGYPASHRTPSLESNPWIYWTNRWRSIAVEFNEQGKVVSVR